MSAIPGVGLTVGGGVVEPSLLCGSLSLLISSLKLFISVEFLISSFKSCISLDIADICASELSLWRFSNFMAKFSAKSNVDGSLSVTYSLMSFLSPLTNAFLLRVLRAAQVC